MQLKGTKKKKTKKKVDISMLDAEIDKIAAQGTTPNDVSETKPLV